MERKPPNRADFDNTQDFLVEHWKYHRCDDCRSGGRSKCTTTEENKQAVRIDENGKRHLYCFVGCMMLEIGEEARRQFAEAQFNREGHYEKMANP